MPPYPLRRVRRAKLIAVRVRKRHCGRPWIGVRCQASRPVRGGPRRSPPARGAATSEGVTWMKRVVVFLATGLLALAAAQVAKADVSFTDPAGDSGTAPDITAVTAANDPAGNLTFTVRTNQP